MWDSLLNSRIIAVSKLQLALLVGICCFRDIFHDIYPIKRNPSQIMPSSPYIAFPEKQYHTL